MKVIDLLNKIANKEEVPERILYGGYTYWYDKLNKDYYTYICKDLEDEDISYLFDNCFASDILNDEIEIIGDTPKEDKKIEKLDDYIAFCDGTYETRWSGTEMYIVDKLNEIIDRLNGKDNDSE